MTTMAASIPDTLHLSRLVLSPRSRQVARDLSNPYNLHQTLLNAFDSDQWGGARDASGRLLFRVEPEKTYSPVPPTVLVQAHSPADWTAITDRFPAYFDRPPEQKAVVLRRFELELGATVAFRIRVNPIWNEPIKGAKRGKRRPLLGEEQQLEWFSQRLRKNGAEVIHARPRHEGVQHLSKANSSKSVAITFSLIEGTMKVTDGQLLSRAIANGIGPGKAFGCGLLSLAPA